MQCLKTICYTVTQLTTMTRHSKAFLNLSLCLESGITAHAPSGKAYLIIRAEALQSLLHLPSKYQHFHSWLSPYSC